MTVLEKASRVQADTEEQESLFRESSIKTEKCDSATLTTIKTGQSTTVTAFHMAEDMPPQSVDMAVFAAVPIALCYTSEACDIGNTATVDAEAAFILDSSYKALVRVLKPGRGNGSRLPNPRMKRAGEVGLCDFRGMNIRIGERAGLVYEYDWMVQEPASTGNFAHGRESFSLLV